MPSYGVGAGCGRDGGRRPDGARVSGAYRGSAAAAAWFCSGAGACSEATATVISCYGARTSGRKRRASPIPLARELAQQRTSAKNPRHKSSKNRPARARRRCWGFAASGSCEPLSQPVSCPLSIAGRPRFARSKTPVAQRFRCPKLRRRTRDTAPLDAIDAPRRRSSAP